MNATTMNPPPASTTDPTERPPALDVAITETWRTLAASASAAARFDPSTCDDLPEPAARWLRRVLPDATPLVAARELTMSGRIRIGRWMPFEADQVLRAGVGFVWRPVVGGRLVRFTGADLLGPDIARMEFRFHGRFPVVKASGPDTRRSAAGRLAAETVAWLPEALAPQSGARWRSVDAERAVVTVATPEDDVDVEVRIGPDGRLRTLRLQRWNDSLEPPALKVFGGRITDEHVTSAGVRIAGTGAVGWGFGTSAWDEGEFFRFVVEGARPVRG